MAQFKKDSVKQKIDLTALRIFSDKGYRDTKISDVAESAGISVGNIYRYYKGKEELFYSILPREFIVSLKELLKEKINEMNNEKRSIVYNMREISILDEAFIIFLIQNRERILILFNDDIETSYYGIKKEFIDYVIQAVAEVYTFGDLFNRLKEEQRYFILKSIYENMVVMTLNILKQGENLQEVKEMLIVMNTYHLLSISNLFKYKE